MKRLLLLLCGLMSLVMSVHAADQDEFTYTYKGHTLNYLVLSESKRTCAVIGSTSGPVGALELPDFPIKNGIEYTLVEIAGYAFYYCRGLTSVEIPNSVKTIGDRAFYMCTGLTSVVIGNSVMSIGYEAFADCSWLKKSAYPDNIPNPFSTGIAFAYSAQGTTIEDGVIFDRAKTTIYFAPVTLSGEYTVPSTVKTIADDAFSYCTELTSVEIPNSVKIIGDGAFFSCTGLISVIIGNSVDDIGIGAFNGCTGLTSVVIGNSVKSIGNSAFAYCSGLTSVVIPNSVQTIGYGTFYGCSGLTSVVIGNSVKSIGNDAFAYCSGLKKSAYPDNISNPFSYGRAIAYSAQETTIEDGVIFDRAKTTIYFAPVTLSGEYTVPSTVKTIADDAFSYCTELTSVEIPNSVKIIGDGAFFSCTGLISVIIGNSVDDIGIGAFNGCTGLTSVVIGNSVKSIGNSAFAYCSGLTSVVIPNSVQTIGYGTFYGCSGLTSVVIGNSVKSIGNDAFAYCSGLKKSAYPDNISNPFSYGRAIAYSAQETTIEDGVIFDQAKTTLYFAPATLAGEYTVPSTVKTIADNAFSYCEDITYVRMPATLSSIGKNAFLGCRLYDFTIPNAVKSFDMATLSGNPLKSLTVGSGVTQISGTAYFLNGIEKIFWLGNNPPEGCYSFNNTIVNFVSNDQYEFGNQILYPFLSSMFDVEGIVYVPVSPSERTCNVVDYFYAPSNAVFSVPPTVTNKGIQLKVIDVGAYAFYHHDYLTDITLDNNGVIDDYAFYNCIKLQSVTFGNNIPEIKNHTFENCEVLKKVENSPALISIGEWAFSGCVGMEYFSVGDKATSFGEEAFSDCTGLTEFYSYAATPPVCGKQALDDIIKWNCKLYVPIGSETLYASAPQWKDFFYIDGVESGIDTIFIDPQNNNIEIFDINGIKLTTRLEDLPAGIYIVRQGKNVKKIAVK